MRLRRRSPVEIRMRCSGPPRWSCVRPAPDSAVARRGAGSRPRARLPRVAARRHRVLGSASRRLPEASGSLRFVQAPRHEGAEPLYGGSEREARERSMDADAGNGKARTFTVGLILGALVGAGLALLLAPQSGADTRRNLVRRARRLADESRDRYDDARRRLRRAREQRRDLKAEASAE